MPTYHSIAVRNNVTFRHTFPVWEQPDGEPVDLTDGYKAFMQVRWEGSMVSPQLDLSSERGELILGADGLIEVRVERDRMLKISPDDYVYDLVIVGGEYGDTVPIYYGKFSVRAGVTRPDRP